MNGENSKKENLVQFQLLFKGMSNFKKIKSNPNFTVAFVSSIMINMWCHSVHIQYGVTVMLIL